MYGITRRDIIPPPTTIQKYNSSGDFLETWPAPQCEHTPTPEIGHLSIFHIVVKNEPYLVISCILCRSMTLINTRDGSRIPTYTNGGRNKPVPGRMCDGPAGTFLAINSIRNRSEVIMFDCRNTSLAVNALIPKDMDDPVFIAYLETKSTGGLVIACDWKHSTIVATSLSDKKLIWRLQGEVKGKMIRPNGMDTDDEGRLYVGDGANSRIIVLDGSTGYELQVKELPEYGVIVNVLWCNIQHQLIVHHVNNGREQITYFGIE